MKAVLVEIKIEGEIITLEFGDFYVIIPLS